MSRLHAKLEPLKGKYYGTHISLSTTDGGSAGIEVWVNGVTDYKPSEREIDGHDESEYGEYEICDDHYETQGAYVIADKIVAALDGIEL